MCAERERERDTFRIIERVGIALKSLDFKYKHIPLKIWGRRLTWPPKPLRKITLAQERGWVRRTDTHRIAALLVSERGKGGLQKGWRSGMERSQQIWDIFWKCSWQVLLSETVMFNYPVFDVFNWGIVDITFY